MPLSTIVSAGVWVGTTYAITTTSVVVWPPGLDCDPSRIPTLTYRKASSAVIAINDVVNMSKDSTGDIYTPGPVGSYRVQAVAAAGAGTTTFQGKRIPQFLAGSIKFKDGQGSNFGWFGDPGVQGESAFAKDLDYAPPPNFVPVYGYIDGGGATHTTQLIATAVAGVAYWVEGGARPAAHPGPLGVDIMARPVMDTGRNFPLDGLSISNKTATIQASGTISGLSGAIYRSADGLTVGQSIGTSTPIFVGWLVGVDTRTSPKTYSVQCPPFVTFGTDPTLAPLISSQATVTPRSGGSYAPMCSILLSEVGINYDNFVTVTATSGATLKYPTTALQIFAPIIDNAPDFAVDCTLPAPFGAVRVIWAAGRIQMTKKTDGTTAPRTSMVRSNWNPAAPKTVNYYSVAGSTPGSPYGLTRSGNGSCPYPLRGWNGDQVGFGLGADDYNNSIAPYRLGVIPSSVRLLVNFFIPNGAGLTLPRIEYQWVRRNALTRSKKDVIGSVVNAGSPYFTGSAGLSSFGVYWDLTISAPTGATDDVSCFAIYAILYVTYLGVESAYLAGYAPPIPLDTGAVNGDATTPFLNIWRPPSDPFNGCGVLAPVSGDPYPLEVWPEDIARWQPAPNDSGCSYVGHNGWKWPNPTPMPTVSRSSTGAASWSANVLTITAMPTMTWTGNGYVDGPTKLASPSANDPKGILGYAFRISCPTLGLNWDSISAPLVGNGTPTSFASTSISFWVQSATAAQIAFAFGPTCVPPYTINCPKPAATGAVDIILELWEVRLVGTTFGGDAQLANFQRITVNIP